MKNQVFIIGLGLIGGSIALAIKKEHDCQVIGYDIATEQVKVARALKVIDESVATIEEGVRKADLIVLATPVSNTIAIFEEMQSYTFKEGVIITDVGSTKSSIIKEAAKLVKKGIHFIGGHPMAGSHKSGVQAAKAHLFENAFYILTPSAHIQQRTMIQLQNWLKGTKAKFITMLPEEHDRVAGAVSHLPHIIATSLVREMAKKNEAEPMLSRLAAGGFRDITRIASASPVMWRDILLHNKVILLQQLSEWMEEMQHVKKLLEDKDAQAIFHYFDDAKRFRDDMPVREKGAIPAFYDLFVDVPDHPGVISDVTSILADHQISITNIRILETREDIMGVLRLSFRSEDDRELARSYLERSLYETSIL
ncbi:prephenate dehydrogenase [Alkalihalobacillus pseudalcaliphilus]|uniref:prephenate dehydrogenase n=1 Tax=Alkalihalobacillus pseudalcaliphilus TaxID=79884 RepID=UPI00064DEE35|nr:prephenate dehydrogenase [Alkalihalobacillus pseudalcaliphilus]KMK76429.1 prephenate dehydrogenase [Alkalihalobacillus pseudalcaliphilus]